MRRSAEGVLAAEGAERKSDLQAWEADEERPVSRFSKDLLQLVPAPHVPPSGWACSQCDKTDNLWLNLTDGAIGCGRRNFDGTGGNQHALEHARSSGFPLAVKLGTLTPALDAVGGLTTADEWPIDS